MNSARIDIPNLKVLKDADATIQRVITRNKLDGDQTKQLLAVYELANEILQSYQKEVADAEKTREQTNDIKAAIISSFNYARSVYRAIQFSSGDWLLATVGKVLKPNVNDEKPTSPPANKTPKKRSFFRGLFRLFSCTRRQDNEQMSEEAKAESVSVNIDEKSKIETVTESTSDTAAEENNQPAETEKKSDNLFLNGFNEYKNTLEQKYDDLAKALKVSDDAQCFNIMAKALKKDKSLWYSPNCLGSFLDNFLIHLRHTNIVVYRDLIKQSYGIKLIPADRKLYRGDSRHYTTIFSEGFRLQPAANDFREPKCRYNCSAGSTGISLSHWKSTASSYGGNNYYKVCLPQGHRLLIADFSRHEVNSLDDIPPDYIKYCKTYGEKVYNPKFMPEKVVASPQISRGCY